MRTLSDSWEDDMIEEIGDARNAWDQLLSTLLSDVKEEEPEHHLARRPRSEAAKPAPRQRPATREALIPQVKTESSIVAPVVLPKLPQTLLLPEPHIQVAEEVPVATPKVEPKTRPRDLSQLRVVPTWGRKPFPVLYFTTGSTRFSAPLVLLNSVASWRSDEVVKLPGQPDWHLGIWMHRGERVNLIDLERLLLPEQETYQPMPEQGFVVRMGDGRWGLVCKSLDDLKTLQPDTVRWRKAVPGALWVAGIGVNDLSAVINIQSVLKMIEPVHSRAVRSLDMDNLYTGPADLTGICSP